MNLGISSSFKASWNRKKELKDLQDLLETRKQLRIGKQISANVTMSMLVLIPIIS